MTSVTVVLDTNVLVYLFDGQDAAKQHRARTTMENLGALGTAAIPAQVLAEFSSVMLRKKGRAIGDVTAVTGPLASPAWTRRRSRCGTILRCLVGSGLHGTPWRGKTIATSWGLHRAARV